MAGFRGGTRRPGGAAMGSDEISVETSSGLSFGEPLLAMVSSLSWVETSSDDCVVGAAGRQNRESGGTGLPHALQRDIRASASSVLAEVYAKKAEMGMVGSVGLLVISPLLRDLLESDI